MQYLKTLSIKNICILGFALRLLMLAIVLFFSEDVSTGLLGSTNLNDDVRYLEIAEAYAKYANFIIDVPAFRSALDLIETGYNHEGFIDLWYWIVCVLYFVLRSEILVKIVNIVFAVVSIKCIYNICNKVYDRKVAKMASALYAFFPYPIIFSCFLYKDQFYTMVTLLLFSAALKCAGNVKIKDVLWMSFLVIVSMMTRSGLVLLVVGAVFVIIYKKGNYKIKKSTVLIALPIVILIVGLIAYASWESIQRKLLAYVYEFSLDSKKNTIDFFIIKTPSQIWKYPLSLCFLLFQPLKLSLGVHCWMDIAGFLNIVSIPIAIGNILYLFSIKQKKSYLFWIFHAFFLVTIVTSLGIVRHQYYLQPFMMIIFASYYYSIRKKNLMWLTSVMLGVFLIGYWMYQI